MSEAASKHTFRKKERLCSRKEIDRLFANGLSISLSPLKIIFLTADNSSDCPCKTMFVAPKRNFRKAHDRNLLKRRMREAFRLNKKSLYERLTHSKKTLSLAILFTGRKEESFEVIEKSLKGLTEKMLERLT